MIPDSIGKEEVIRAIEEIEEAGVPEKRESTKYDLVYNEKKYPPKYVISIANKYANDEELDPNKFHGGKEANPFLRNLGFEIRSEEETIDNSFSFSGDLDRLLNIEDYILDLDALNLALSEYQNFRGSEEYKESYKWDILGEIQQTLSEGIDEETVEEFVEKLREKNPSSGSFVNWRETEKLEDFVEENPGKAFDLISRLFNEDIEINERIEDLRNSVEIGTPMIGYILSAYDHEKYAPIKVRNFRKFLDYFSVKKGKKVTTMSVGKKYQFYTLFCEKIAEFISDNSTIDPTALNAQDFMYCLTSDYSIESNYILKYLYQFSRKIGEYKENTEDLISEIKNLPVEFFQEEREKYEDREKVSKIRYKITDRIIENEELDLEEIKNNVKTQYETNILHSWNDFTILAQIYLDYYKEIFRKYFEELSTTLIDELGEENIESHIVDFQGAQNFPTDVSWIALYPSSKSSHEAAYQLHLAIRSRGVEYGLMAGSNVENGEKDSMERIKKMSEIEIENIVSKFENVKDQFYQLNEISKKEKIEKQKKDYSHFILVTGGGEYEDKPEEVYHFKEGIPGLKQLREANRTKVVYYGDGEFYAEGEIKEIDSEEVDDTTHFKGKVKDYNEFEDPVSLEDVEDLISVTFPTGPGIVKISREDYDTILSIGPEMTSFEGNIGDILNDVFLNDEDAVNVREYFVKLFTFLEDPDRIKSKLDTTYNKPRKKISVNFGQWQVFSIERKGNSYYAQFAVDMSKVPNQYSDWIEFEEEWREFELGEEEKLVKVKWSSNLFQKHPELREAWKSAIDSAKSIFKDWSGSPYHQHHKEEIYNWIMKGFSERKEHRVKKDKLLELNNNKLEFGELDFTEGLFFPEDIKTEINQSVRSALKSGKNIIFTGPPGTGKTKLAKNVAEKVKENCNCVEGYIFTTATADWTTFDTIGGYHPEKEGGSLSFEPGQFLKCFKDKEKDPVNNWLIIDEINRADIDKAFGQLFSVLSNDGVKLPFTDDDGRTISINPLDSKIDENGLNYSDSDYYVTRNWRLLATMNTFDKASLYEMSYAFMRRFAFIDVGVPTEDIGVELIGDYISMWEDLEREDVEEFLEDLAGIWETLNKGKRAIGPAIIRDMLLFLREYGERDGLVNALKLYVLPQLEGMVKQDQKQIFISLVENTKMEKEDLEKVARERFEIEDLEGESE